MLMQAFADSRDELSPSLPTGTISCETNQVDHPTSLTPTVKEFARRRTSEWGGCGYHRAQQRAFIADGARWLWDLADLQFPDAVQILDWFHLSERVHETAAALFGQGTAEAEKFREARLDELWNGRSGETLKELRTRRNHLRSITKRDSLRELITYVENHRRRID